MPNPHLQAFYGQLESKYSISTASMSTSTWLEKNTRLKGRPFSHTRYEFQRAIVDDLHPNMDVEKCSQVGLTEVQIRKMLAILRRNNGLKGIFTFPNEKMFKKNSNSRIKPLLDENPVFNFDDGARSMGLIQMQQSFLFVTGATEGDATSTDADVIFNDEVDLTDQKMLALFSSRMQNSDWKISQRFSTPTFMGYGIQLGFASSDQHEYLCRCTACGHHNIPDFDYPFLDIPGLDALRDELPDLSYLDTKQVETLDLLNSQVVCEKCRSPLDLDNPSLRAWVPRFPSRKHARGYKVRPFCTSRIDIAYIITQLLKYKERNYTRGWFNTVLGRAYTDSNAQLSEADIRSCMVGEAQVKLTSEDPCWVGIDVGQTCHIVVRKGEHGPVAMFVEVPANQIIAWITTFCETHNVIAGAMDRHPYTPTADAIFSVSKGKIFPVEYRGEKEINAKKDAEKNIVYFQANRTNIIDEVANQIRAHKLPLAGYGHNDHLIISHLRDMVRDESPEEAATWKKLTGADHYFHALAFLLFAQKIPHYVEVTSDEERRTMMSIVGVDVQGSKQSLVGSTSRSTSNLYEIPAGRKTQIISTMTG